MPTAETPAAAPAELTPDQVDHLENACHDTAEAIREAGKAIGGPRGAIVEAVGAIVGALCPALVLLEDEPHVIASEAPDA